MSVKKIVGVIGPNYENCTADIYNFGVLLGQKLSELDVIIASGGRLGLMEAVFKGAKQFNKGQIKTMGILPSGNKTEANKFCDLVVATGIGLARNSIVANTADILVAVAGGAGTLSEIAFAWQFNKKVICYTGFEGWANNLAGLNLDNRNTNLLLKAGSVEQIIDLVIANTGLDN
ncbi:MAG: TIGR00725 family protein [Chlorobi bacterium]|nr:TIGR00725 family protein [Chlorobiota bacterium]